VPQLAGLIWPFDRGSKETKEVHQRSRLIAGSFLNSAGSFFNSKLREPEVLWGCKFIKVQIH
jgi:hypothetical protein